MSELLHNHVWLLPAALIVAFFAAIWWTHFVAYGRGRYDGLVEADLRNRRRDRHDYQRGVIDTARRAGEILRKRGAIADAAAVPEALLRKPSTSDQPTPEGVEQI